MLVNQWQKIFDCFVEFKVEFDLQCLEQELVLLVQKSDVVEELDCFVIYVGEVCWVFKVGGVVGWCLDFLMQEFNWEVNILGFKVFDLCLIQVVVNFKVLIEQMCEQVQNIE